MATSPLEWVAHSIQHTTISSPTLTSLHSQLQYDLDTLHSSLIQCFQHHLIPLTSTCTDEIQVGCKSAKCPYIKFNLRKADCWPLNLFLHNSSGYLFDFTSPSSSITPFDTLLFFGN